MAWLVVEVTAPVIDRAAAVLTPTAAPEPSARSSTFARGIGPLPLPLPLPPRAGPGGRYSSDLRGGEAPARSTVWRRRRGEARGLGRGLQVGQRLAPKPRECHQARKPPLNASPAPIVSTTSAGARGTATSSRGVTTIAPSPPRVSATTIGPPLGSIARVASTGAAPGIQPADVLLADLDQVGVAQQPRQARAVPVGIVDRPTAGS